jgi:glycosyltransferase involved in cell wall biosynthesis
MARFLRKHHTDGRAPVKILHATKKYPALHGGDAVVVANLERLQVAGGAEVIILTSNCAETQRRPEVYRFGLPDRPAALDRISPKRLLSLLILIFQAFRILRRERPDVIHTHSVDMAFAVSVAARAYRIPIVHTFHIVASHDQAQGFLRNRVEMALARAARPALVTALNKPDLDHLKSAGLNAVLLPNGLDMSLWKPIPLRPDNTRFGIISVGRLEKQKNFGLLIRAAALLTDDVDIKIVGDGSLRPELDKLITQSRVAKRVELLGPKSIAEIRELFPRIDAVVICSLYEAMPLALLEAWASGRPVITTEVGMVQPNAEGKARGVHLIADRDPATLADAIRRLQADRSYREELIEAGFAEVRQYDWRSVQSLLSDYYAQVIGAAKGAGAR